MPRHLDMLHLCRHVCEHIAYGVAQSLYEKKSHLFARMYSHALESSRISEEKKKK